MSSVFGSGIPFIDLKAQKERLGDRIELAIAGVLDHGRFINGPEIARFEEELAARCAVDHVVSCASGTDALLLALMALEVGPGDAVFVPAFTFAATAEIPALLGASPVFVDVDRATFNLDPASLVDAIEYSAEGRLRPAAVIPVDLFGAPADYDAIHEAVSTHGVEIVGDAAQSLGGRYHDRPVGCLARITATSFFPAKPLGCYGDGGAVLTSDASLAERMRSLREHGRGAHKYDHPRVGVNARMDTIQAAVLLEKLSIFDEEIDARQRIARRYDSGFHDRIVTQAIPDASTSAWAQYTIMVDERDRVIDHLTEKGIPTAIYYPLPLHLQPAYRDLPRAPSGLPVAEALATRSLSIPFHPYLTPQLQDAIVAEVLASSSRETVGG